MLLRERSHCPRRTLPLNWVRVHDESPLLGRKASGYIWYEECEVITIERTCSGRGQERSGTCIFRGAMSRVFSTLSRHRDILGSYDPYPISTTYEPSDSTGAGNPIAALQQNTTKTHTRMKQLEVFVPPTLATADEPHGSCGAPGGPGAIAFSFDDRLRGGMCSICLGKRASSVLLQSRMYASVGRLSREGNARHRR